jgi:hypothetical protein
MLPLKGKRPALGSADRFTYLVVVDGFFAPSEALSFFAPRPPPPSSLRGAFEPPPWSVPTPCVTFVFFDKVMPPMRLDYRCAVIFHPKNTVMSALDFLPAA